MKNLFVTTSWDDGDALDLKLAELLLQYKIRGTFYVTTHNPGRGPIKHSDLKELSRHFEIGAHTITHPDLRSLNDQALNYEICGSKLELENLLGIPVNMFSYPWGKYNRRVLKAVKQAGFYGARTTKEYSIECYKDPFQIPTTLNVYLHPPIIYLRHALLIKNINAVPRILRIVFKNTWFQIAMSIFEEATESGGVWHLWGHSRKVEEQFLWQDLKELFSIMSSFSEVKYVTNNQLLQNIY